MNQTKFIEITDTNGLKRLINVNCIQHVVESKAEQGKSKAHITMLDDLFISTTISYNDIKIMISEPDKRLDDMKKFLDVVRVQTLSKDVYDFVNELLEEYFR